MLNVATFIAALEIMLSSLGVTTATVQANAITVDYANTVPGTSHRAFVRRALTIQTKILDVRQTITT